MNKTISRVVIALFAIALITSCGTRNGDKCPGVGKVATEQVKRV